MQPELTPASRPSLAWYGCLALAAAALFYGLPQGDVTNAEATILLQVNEMVSGQELDGTTAPSGWFAESLAKLHTLLGIPLSVEAVRLFSLLAVLASVVVLDVYLRVIGGSVASAAAGLMMVCSYPAMVLSHRISESSWLGFLVISALTLLACSLCSKRFLVRLMLGVGGVVAAGLAVFLLPNVQVTADVEDRIVGLYRALQSTMPWLPVLLLVGHKGFWSSLHPTLRSASLLGIGLLACGVTFALCVPDHWMLAGWIVLAGTAVVGGVAWQAWFTQSLSESVSRLHFRLARIIAVGTPACIALLGTARIFERYNFMERVQAVVVVSIVAFTIALLVMKQRRTMALYWVPVLALFLACKFAYVHVHLLERDHWQSPKPYAKALRNEVDHDVQFFMQMTPEPAFRYYFGGPIKSFHDLNAVDSNREKMVLVYEKDWDRLRQVGWNLVRLYDSLNHQSVMLIAVDPLVAMDKARKSTR